MYCILVYGTGLTVAIIRFTIWPDQPKTQIIKLGNQNPFHGNYVRLTFIPYNITVMACK